MKAAAFVRYHSGDGMGHVAWAFEVEDGCAVCGSVENHSGHIFTPATKMGYWDAVGTDPESEMRKRGYDEVKWMDVSSANPLAAYRTMLWIKTKAYYAIHRNCEDDVYDILRAYGVKDLPLPLFHWMPTNWFCGLTGIPAPVHTIDASQRRAAPNARVDATLNSAAPQTPAWRKLWHPQSHSLKFEKMRYAFRRA